MANGSGGGTMPSEGGTVELHAKIYPGMFPGEVQATIEIDGEQINLTVSEDFVEYPKEKLNTDGVDGKLYARIVDKTDDVLLIHLPGDVHGASNRMELATA